MKDSSLIRLLIVDDHPLFREGLLHSLAAERAFKVIGQAEDGATAIHLWKTLRPDVTLMDVSMYGQGGIETTRRILAVDPSARVLMLTSSEEQHDAIEALQAGAAGYISKTVRFDELLAAIREVHAGGRPIGEAVARRLAAADRGGPLSPRELEVLALLRDGLSYQEVGRSLHMAERTARAHVAAIKEKLAAATAAQCVARGYELGLLRPRSAPAI
jgi:DNA-binding NarL/FixJ family response regulator